MGGGDAAAGMDAGERGSGGEAGCAGSSAGALVCAAPAHIVFDRESCVLYDVFVFESKSLCAESGRASERPDAGREARPGSGSKQRQTSPATETGEKRTPKPTMS